MAKMGRPTINPRTERICIRISKEELEMLQQCVEKIGTNKTDVLIKGLKEIYQEINKN